MQIDAAAQYYRQLAQDLMDQAAIMISRNADLQREVDGLREQLKDKDVRDDAVQ